MESHSTSATESSQLSTELSAAIPLCNFRGIDPMTTRQPFLDLLSSETHDTITNSQDHQVTTSSNKRKVTEEVKKLKKRDRDMRYRQRRKEDLEKAKEELCLLEQKIAHLKQENDLLKEKKNEQNAAFLIFQKEVEKAAKDVAETRILNIEQGVVMGHVQEERSMPGETERRLQIEIQELRVKCENFEAERSVLMTESIRLNSEINDLKEQLRTKDRENVRLQGRVVYLESKVNGLNIDLEGPAGQLAGSKASDRLRRCEELDLEEARLMENLKQGQKELKAMNKALLDRLVKLESKLEMQEVDPSSSYTQREHSTM